MSWLAIKRRGSGAVSFRLQIEGFPYEAVTAEDMELTASDGRVRLCGLRSETIQLKERVDLTTCKWTPEGFSVSIADKRRRWAAAFKVPTAVTYLDGSLTAGATSATVKATGAFATSGRIYLDGEVMSYTASNTAGTIFQGLTRGVWGTQAEQHYITLGDSTRFPEVTNWPRSIEGKRAYLYVYGSGDDRTSTSPTAGTLIWTGLVATEPTYDGTAWTFQIDPVTRSWDSDIGGDLDAPLPLRGIYYPAAYPLIVKLEEWNAASQPASTGLAAEVTFAIAGQWEDNVDFCADLTSEIATQQASPDSGTFTQTVVAVPIGESWGLQFVGAATPHYMVLSAQSATDNVAGSLWQSTAVPVAFTVTTGNTYQVRQSLGQVPRGTIGVFRDERGFLAGLAAARKVNLDEPTYPRTRVYVGGTAGISSRITAAAVEWESNGADPTGLTESFSCSVTGTDATARYLDLSGIAPLRRPGERSHYAGIGHGAVSIRIGRSLGSGNLRDFLTAVTGDVPTYVNAGSVPDIRASDFATNALSTSGTIAQAAAGNVLAQSRGYTMFAPQTFADIVQEECKLLGVFPAFDTNGKITFHPLRLPSPSEAFGATVTAGDIATGKDGWLGWERSPKGQIATVDLYTGYNPVDDEWQGTLQRVRDVEVFGRNRLGKTLEIKPYSTDRFGGFSYEDVVAHASKITGVFGSPYAYLTIRVKLSKFDALCGSVVSIGWSKIPNPQGTLGVEGKLGIVVAREWDIRGASGSLTLLVTDLNFAGYTPSARLSNITGTTGTTGPFSANMSASYFPGSTQADDYFTAGDLIRLYRWNDTTPDIHLGTVSSVVGNAIVFTTTTNWTRSTHTWCLGFRVSTEITADSQKRFAFIANADATLDWSGDAGNPPFVLAP